MSNSELVITLEDTLAHLREAREMLGRLVGGELRNM